VCEHHAGPSLAWARQGERRILRTIAEMSSQGKELRGVFDSALDGILEHLGMHAGCFLISGGADTAFHLAAQRGFGGPALAALEEAPGAGLSQQDSPCTLDCPQSAAGPFAALQAAMAGDGWRQLILAPIRAGGRLLGLLYLAHAGRKTLTAEELGFLDTVRAGCAGAIVAHDLKEQARKLSEDMVALQEMNKIITQRTELDDIVRGVVNEGKRLVKTRHCHLFLSDERSPRLRCSATTQTDEFDVQQLEFDLSDESPPATAARERCTVAVPRFTHQEPSLRHLAEQTGWRSAIFAPLIAKDHVTGILVCSDQERSFSQEDVVRAETLANQAALAIENARLFQVVRRSQREWETTIDAMQDCISVHDPAGNLVRANRALARRFHTVPQQLIGRPCADLYGTGELRFENCRHMQCLQAESLVVEEVDLPHMGGTFQLSVSPWYDKNDRVVGAIHIARDISREKLLQQQLIQSEKLSAIGELVSGIAHELNNPLTGVMGYSQLLQLRSDLDERARDSLQKINNLALRCQKIVQNLLSFARKQKPERTLTCVNDILEKTIELRSYELSVNNIRVQSELDRNLPRTIADAHQLQQVFLNVITNAEQAMLDTNGRGSLVVRSRTDAKNNRIVVEIQDDGPGIPEKLLTRIFDPFFSTKEVGKGTGLGLSIAYGIVQQHGGMTYARSRPGEGSTFVIELPIVTVVQQDAPMFPILMPQALHFEGLIRGKRILVVDDEKYILDFFVEILRMFPARVDTACDGLEAMDKLQADRYDLILTDYKMPQMSGKELFYWIRQHQPNLARRIIFITGDTVSAETRSFFESTASRYLGKPFKIEEVKEIIQQTLEAAD